LFVGSSAVAAKTNAVGTLFAQSFTTILTFQRATGESHTLTIAD